MKQQSQADTHAYKSDKGFIKHYQDLIIQTVIPYQYEILNDRIEGVEKSHVIANFINAGKALRGEDIGDGFYGMVFQDSDAAKWLEAVAYSLILSPDASLEQKADDLIDIIAQAQDTDGYLNTYYTIKDRDKRWTNLLEGHELYCAGHMMEAAVAYYDATSKDKLLRVMEQNAEHIYRHFVVDGHPGYPGHPEVELALMRLYEATGNPHTLELAQHFIDVRGVDPDFYKMEVAARDWYIWGNNPDDYDYQQSGKPVREQSDATGHSVRAVYLYTAMSHLASQTDDETLFHACRRLWDSIVKRRMYVTGSIGSTVLGEAFTVDYNLPNDTAYSETCASIGLMFFSSRMLETEVNSEYADIMERAFYNTVLAGMQLDGKRFFYVNPLEVIPDVSGVAATHKHDLPTRPTWYPCACCPPNVSRLITGIGKYAYGENETTAFCHLYAAGEIQLNNGMAFTCKTDYPYGLTVTYEITKGGKDIAIRIPGWSRNTLLMRNGKSADAQIKNGYAYFSSVQEQEQITLTFDDTIQRIYASSKVAADTGCVAIQRGPLVYCFEGIDNEEDILSLSIAADGNMTACDYDANLLNGTIKLQIDGYRTETMQTLYSMERPVKIPYTLTATPYYTWSNRGLSQMRVWLPEQ